MEIEQIHMPEETQQLRALMADYLREFDSAGDPTALWDAEYYATCAGGVRAGTHYLAFAREAGDVIGFVIARIEPLWYRPSVWLGHVEELYVQPQHRRMGVGSLLVSHVSAEAYARGARSVVASVLQENRIALKFWQAIGYELRVHNLYGPARSVAATL